MIPVKLREKMAKLPEYHDCLRRVLLRDHVCSPDPVSGKLIEWEHTLTYAGKQIQEMWAIIPICWWSHRGPGLNKAINRWIALNRATDKELEKYRKANFIQMKNGLNETFGKIPK